MNWLFFALLSPAIYTVNIFIDKYLLETRIPNYRSIPIFTAILAFFVGIIFFILNGFELLDPHDLGLVLITGIFTIWGASLYFEALSKEQASIITILIQLIPIMVLILSFLILGEKITAKQMLGFFLLLLSVYLISFKKDDNLFKPSQTLLFIILADILWSIPYIAIKFVSSSISFYSLLAFESWGILIGGIILYLFFRKIRKAFLKTVKSINRLTLGIIFFNEFVYVIGKTSAYFALTLGPASLVAVLGSTQIFFGIIYGIFLTIIARKIFKEDRTFKGILKKSFLGFLAFVGIYFVS